MRSAFLILLISAISGCGSPASPNSEQQIAHEFHDVNRNSLLTDSIAGFYNRGNGSIGQDFYLTLAPDCTFSCSWFNYGSRGCAGGELRGDCTGLWVREDNVVKTRTLESSGYFESRPLGELRVVSSRGVQILTQINDIADFDMHGASDDSCFRKHDPSMKPYPKLADAPDDIKSLIENNAGLAREMEPLGFNPVDGKYIFEICTNSKFAKILFEQRKLKPVPETHFMVTTLVHSILDDRLRWKWPLKNCRCFATADSNAGRTNANFSYCVVEHPDSNETIVFVGRN